MSMEQWLNARIKPSIREFRQFGSLTPKRLVEYRMPYSDL